MNTMEIRALSEAEIEVVNGGVVSNNIKLGPDGKLKGEPLKPGGPGGPILWIVLPKKK